jgi:hypothetical protein
MFHSKKAPMKNTLLIKILLPLLILATAVVPSWKRKCWMRPPLQVPRKKILLMD